MYVPCRLFSRAPGWCAPDKPPVPTRHFWSPAVRVPARLARAWRGWRAARVASAVREKTPAFENAPLLRVAEQFPDWIFYPKIPVWAGVRIPRVMYTMTTGPSHSDAIPRTTRNTQRRKTRLAPWPAGETRRANGPLHGPALRRTVAPKLSPWS